MLWHIASKSAVMVAWPASQGCLKLADLGTAKLNGPQLTVINLKSRESSRPRFIVELQQLSVLCELPAFYCLTELATSNEYVALTAPAAGYMLIRHAALMVPLDSGTSDL